MAIHATEKLDLATSAARTSNSTGSSVTVERFIEGRIFLDTTAVSGTTPSMTVRLEDSWDGSTWWNHTNFSAVTAATQKAVSLTTFGKYLRTKWNMTGANASFTFSVVFQGKT